MARKQLTCNSFIFYGSFYEAISVLPLDNQGRIYDAIFKFAFEDIEAELEGIELAVFLLIKPQLLANRTKYENGCKGGRPRKQSETEEKPNENRGIFEIDRNDNQTETRVKSKQNRNKTKQKPKHNLSITEPKPNENDNVNDNENVNDNHHLPLTPSCEDEDDEDNINNCFDEKFTFYYDLLQDRVNAITDDYYKTKMQSVLAYCKVLKKKQDFIVVGGNEVDLSDYLQQLNWLCGNNEKFMRVMEQITCQPNITNPKQYMLTALYNSAVYGS